MAGLVSHNSYPSPYLAPQPSLSHPVSRRSRRDRVVNGWVGEGVAFRRWCWVAAELCNAHTASTENQPASSEHPTFSGPLGPPWGGARVLRFQAARSERLTPVSRMANSPVNCTNFGVGAGCIVKSFRSRRSLISSPLWAPSVYGATSSVP